MHRVIRIWLPSLLLFVAFAAPETRAQDDKRVLRIVPQAGLTILDPIWTRAYVTRNRGVRLITGPWQWPAAPRPRDDDAAPSPDETAAVSSRR